MLLSRRPARLCRNIRIRRQAIASTTSARTSTEHAEAQRVAGGDFPIFGRFTQSPDRPQEQQQKKSTRGRKRKEPAAVVAEPPKEVLTSTAHTTGSETTPESPLATFLNRPIPLTIHPTPLQVPEEGYKKRSEKFLTALLLNKHVMNPNAVSLQARASRRAAANAGTAGTDGKRVETAAQTRRREEDKKRIMEFEQESTEIPPAILANLESTMRDQEFVFSSAPTMHTLSSIEVCLQNQYDVPRASVLFNRLRETKRGHPMLERRLYERMLGSYLVEAVRHSQARKKRATKADVNFNSEFWTLYAIIASGREVAPGPGTFAIALLCTIYQPKITAGAGTALAADSTARVHTPTDILKKALKLKIAPEDVAINGQLRMVGYDLALLAQDGGGGVSEAAFNAPLEVIQLIQRTALDMGDIKVANSMTALSHLLKDATDPAASSDSQAASTTGEGDGPSVNPVTVSYNPKPIDLLQGVSPTKARKISKLQGKVPFNLAQLRQELSRAVGKEAPSPDTAASTGADGVGADGETQTLKPSKTDADPNPIDDAFLISTMIPPITPTSTPTERQTYLESLTYTIARARLNHTLDQLKSIERLGVRGMKAKEIRQSMWDWWHALTKEIEDGVASLKEVEGAVIEEGRSKERGKNKLHIAPYLSLLPANTLALLTITELLRISGSGGIEGGMKATRALVTIGRAVESEYIANVKARAAFLARPLTEKRKRRSMKPGPETSKIDELSQALDTDIRFEQAKDAALASMHRSWSQENEQEQDDVDFDLTTRPPHSFFTTQTYRRLHLRRAEARRRMEVEEPWSPEWTQPLRARVGGFLVESLMRIAKVEVTDPETNKSEWHPAFYHEYEHVRGQKLGLIKLHKAVAERMAFEPVGEHLHARHLPMLVRPKPWTSHESGGYLFNKTSVMRYKDSFEQQIYTKEASSAGNMELLYASLDVLGSTPWKINKSIFDIMVKVWNSGKALCKIPPEKLDLEIPPKPDLNADANDKNVYIQKVQAIHNQRANNHSSRCNVNYQLEIARAFLNDTFYFPHNIDFRGRAYPLPPHLNHIGDDLSRGLLMFAEAKPLGAEGLRWLKIHLAGLYGYDKASFPERVEWVEKHMDVIRDSAENPLEGKQWWTAADDPWQCLATCIELTNALKLDDPASYLSSLPIHQDGTCNGLQHYAALGGDVDGARQVNLVGADRPSDVYSHVARLVDQMVDEDAEKGVVVAQKVRGKINRKLVKQTVMTTVYGVTFVGARLQIAKQLREKNTVEPDQVYASAAYLAKKTMAAIGDLFRGAEGIMTWLKLCARVICKSIPSDRAHALANLRSSYGTQECLTREQMAAVVWTTPLGLPVVQPYRREKKKQVQTAIQTVYISDPHAPQEVNGMKQASAFPPNFIHSLDATHMMLTALECRAKNIAFASVHDSYWTHASSIDEMSSIIRETFISLHSSNILGRLHQEFQKRYGEHKVPVLSLRAPALKMLKDVALREKDANEGTGKSKAEEDVIVKALRGEATHDPLTDPGLTPYERLKEKRKAAKALKAAANASTGVELVEELDEDEIDEVDEDWFEASEAELERQLARSEDDADLSTENELERQVSRSEDDVELSAEDKWTEEQLSRFIDLNNLIPPLPTKGSFDVASIKRSQYFFS